MTLQALTSGEQALGSEHTRHGHGEAVDQLQPAEAQVRHERLRPALAPHLYEAQALGVDVLTVLRVLWERLGGGSG